MDDLRPFTEGVNRSRAYSEMEQVPLRQPSPFLPGYPDT